MSSIKLKHSSGNSMSIAAPATNPASDLELKLPATIGNAGQALINSSTAGTLEFGTPAAASRNLIINGAMQVAQYGTSSTTSGRGTVDRFQHLHANTDEAPTFTQHALTSSDTGPWEKGFRYSLHATNGNQTSGAGATDEVFFYYQIEAQDIATSGWDYTSASSYITLSFWVKSSVAQNFYGHLTSRDGTQQNYPFETGSLSANTWTKITKTIPGNSNITFNNDNGEGLTIGIMPFYGTDYTASGVTLDAWGAKSNSALFPDNTSTWYTTNDSTFEITGVQLEVGSYATDFEHRSYGDELIKCQRYYWKWITEHAYGVLGQGWAAGTTRVDTLVPYPVTMRTAPSFTTGGNFSFSPGTGSGTGFTPTLERSTSSTAYLRSSSVSGLTAGVSGEYRADNDTSAYVAFSAEL